MKFTEIIRKINRNEAERAKLQKDILQKLEEKTEAEQAMQTAAASGDFDVFKTEKAKRDEAEAAASFMKSRLAVPATYEVRQEVFDLWDTYADAYNKGFREKLDKYLRHRAALCNEYLALVQEQNTALQERKTFETFAEENDVDRSGWTPKELEFLERKAPEIAFVSKMKPDIKFGLTSVVGARADVQDWTGDDVDIRLKTFIMHGRTL